MTDFITHWINHDIVEIFGIRAITIARAGKLFQFVAGLVVLVDIIGKERIDAQIVLVNLLLKRAMALNVPQSVGESTGPCWRHPSDFRQISPVVSRGLLPRK